jgi:predicted nuclease with TOPRIM domain
MDPFEIYESLKTSVGEDTAKRLLRYINEIRDGLATKEDIALLRSEFAEMRERMTRLEDKVSQVEDKISHTDGKVTDLETSLANFRVEVKDDIWKLKLYIILLAVLMLITNPTVLELVGKLIGIFK